MKHLALGLVILVASSSSSLAQGPGASRLQYGCARLLEMPRHFRRAVAFAASATFPRGRRFEYHPLRQSFKFARLPAELNRTRTDDPRYATPHLLTESRWDSNRGQNTP
jgi:hypothetical protein